jgi:hypothetical protein
VEERGKVKEKRDLPFLLPLTLEDLKQITNVVNYWN